MMYSVSESLKGVYERGISTQKLVWLLNEMYLIKDGENAKKRTLRYYNLPRLRFCDLEKLYYNQACRDLNSWYGVKREQTSFEHKLHWILDQKRLKIYRSHWIANTNVDFYIPRYRMVIEVNGSIHHKEFKMKKDTCRDNKLMSELGLYVMEVENEDIGLVAEKLLTFLSDKKHRVNSNTVKNDKRRIYIHTIANHMSLDFLSSYFQYDFKSLVEKLDTSSLWYKKF